MRAICAAKILNNALKEVLPVSGESRQVSVFVFHRRPLVYIITMAENSQSFSNYVTVLVLLLKRMLNLPPVRNISCVPFKAALRAVAFLCTLRSVILILVAPNDFYCET